MARPADDGPVAPYGKFAAVNAQTKNGGEPYVPKQVASAFRTYGAVLRPQLRAAFFKVLCRVPGGVANRIVLFGHTYCGIRDITPGVDAAFDLLCDPATGLVVGERYGTDQQIELWHYAVVDDVHRTG